MFLGHLFRDERHRCCSEWYGRSSRSGRWHTCRRRCASLMGGGAPVQGCPAASRVLRTASPETPPGGLSCIVTPEGSRSCVSGGSGRARKRSSPAVPATAGPACMLTMYACHPRDMHMMCDAGGCVGSNRGTRDSADRFVAWCAAARRAALKPRPGGDRGMGCGSCEDWKASGRWAGSGRGGGAGGVCAVQEVTGQFPTNCPGRAAMPEALRALGCINSPRQCGCISTVKAAVTTRPQHLLMPVSW